jgi:hypothetical protein
VVLLLLMLFVSATTINNPDRVVQQTVVDVKCRKLQQNVVSWQARGWRVKSMVFYSEFWTTKVLDCTVVYEK